jgi:hypothetical protein
MSSRRIIPFVVLSSFCAACWAWAGVVPVFIVAGQSNATGFRTNASQLPAAEQQPQNNVLYAGQQTGAVSWAPLVPPTETGVGSRIYGNVPGFGPEAMLGETVSNTLNGHPEVAIVKYTMNASNLATDWNPNLVDKWTLSNTYLYMKDRVSQGLTQLQLQKGLTGQVAGFFWMQGEADAASGRTTAEYEQDLRNFIARVRQDFGPDVPFIFGLINNSDVGPNSIYYHGPNTDAVRLAQMNVAANVNNGALNKIANTYLVNTDPFERDPADPLHFDNNGELALGAAFGNAFVTLTPEPTTLALVPAGVLLLLRRQQTRLQQRPA